MRTLTLALLLASNVAMAECDIQVDGNHTIVNCPPDQDIIGEMAPVDPGEDDGCSISQWRADPILDWEAMKIHGTTTCRSGVLSMQIFAGNGAYVGNETIRIHNGSFRETVFSKKPAGMNIKYSIQ